VRDLRGRAVLVTGGTKGIGLATGLAFAQFGATAVLTYRWGSADEDEIRKRFADLGAPEPLIIQADAGEKADTEALMETLAGRFPAIDVFVNNVAGATMVQDIESLTERALLKTMSYSVWPLVAYLQAIKARFGRYPRYVVATSSPGPDRYSAGYDMVATSKASLEALCRYLCHRLTPEGVRVNIVRTQGVITETFTEAFGIDVAQFIRRLAPEKRLIPAEEVGKTILALCSGMMDGVNGQTITVDRGSAFADNLMRLFDERSQLGI
jgi:NAD(P)-dependent dehydrogenase (short-subunit alcohol dehydrogenase family)